MIKQQKLFLLSSSEEAADVKAFTVFKADKAGATGTSEETLNFLIVQ